MNKIIHRFLITLLTCVTYSAFSQSAPILIDGRFDDWDSSLSTFIDAPESIPGIDFLSFQVTNDENFLYVHFIIDTEVSLVDDLINHGLRLYIDTDNDPTTGFTGAQTGFGSEIGILFKDRFAFFNVTPSSTLSFADLGMRREPTVTSDEYEIAIQRDLVPDGINDLFSSNTIKLLFVETFDDDEMPNLGQSFSYTFDETAVTPYIPVDLERESVEHIRAIAYNTLNHLDDFVYQDEFERIFQALDPDILGLSECSGVSTTEVKSLLDSWLPLGNANGWYVEKDDFDMITASRWQIFNTWDLDRQFAALIDLPEEYPPYLLFVSAHLKCCGDGNVQRQAQVDEFASFILDAKENGGDILVAPNTPFVYCGDMNLVGFAQQYETIVTGDIQDNSTWGPAGALDWDDSDITDVYPVHADAREAYTWKDDTSEFPPGRIDFVFYSDAVMNLPKAYILNTEAMSAARLTQYGLNSNDTPFVSDHLPLIFDMDLGTFTDTDEDGFADEDDNCPLDFNPGQGDWNNNGLGDLCEDSDLDGINDQDELTIFGTNPGNPDSDNDGIEDDDEIFIVGTDPNIQDTDGDGLTDGLEVDFGITNPNLADTDDDGCNDAFFFNYQCEGQTTGNDDCPVDTNFDGVIDILDLINISSNFGVACP